MAFEYLRLSRREWDTIDLRWVDPDRTLEPTEQALRRAGYHAYRTRWDTTSVVDLRGTWEDYLAGRPGKWRNCFRRWERRLKQNGRVEFLRFRPRGERHGDADPRWDLYDACEHIAARSWQANSKTGTTLTHDSVQAFLRATHAAASRFGGLDLNLLLLDGQPTAFAYNYCHRGSVYGLRVGFDPQRSRDGAGSLMCAYSIRDSFQRGDRLYDMGVGYSQTKRHLATRQVPIYRLSHFHPLGAKAQLVRIKRWFEARRLQRDQATALAADG
jgi:CelD/BcsL family acetyltransferase involved in cellulose biosynthesis